MFLGRVHVCVCVQYERAAIEHWIREKQEAMAAAQRELDETGNSQRARRTLDAGVPSPLGYGSLRSLELQPARTVKRLADQFRDSRA